MIKFLTLPMIVLLTLGLSACGAASSAPAPDGASGDSPDAASAVYHTLTAKEAKMRLDSGDELVLLDVRTQPEFAEHHIPGAVCLPNEDIGTEEIALLPDRNAEILVYCRSGRRSREAAEKLVALGYTAVYDFGGILDWPYDTVTGAE